MIVLCRGKMCSLKTAVTCPCVVTSPMVFPANTKLSYKRALVCRPSCSHNSICLAMHGHGNRVGSSRSVRAQHDM